MPNSEQLAFLKMAATAAAKCEQETGCPAELSVAQCVLESAWGTRMPGMNAFGIKATDSHATYQLTKEYLDGQWQTVRAAFEAYDTLADCFIAHARLIQRGRYTDAWRDYEQRCDLDALVDGIAHIYATDPNYAAMVKQIAHEPAVAAALSAARNRVNVA